MSRRGLAYAVTSVGLVSAAQPLSRAYSLLSLSYPLVYLFAALLPGLGASLSAGKIFGVILVVAGVVLINARRTQPVGLSRSPTS